MERGRRPSHQLGGEDADHRARGQLDPFEKATHLAVWLPYRPGALDT